MSSVAAQKWTAVATAAVAALSVAVVGGLATDLGPWYSKLRMPAWKPPDWLFGPAWTVIYALSALSAVSAWWKARDRARRLRILLLFAANALLGILWSVLFFSLRRPDWALFEVAAYWLSIVLLIVGLRPISKMAAWFLAPYLGWVSFAAALNLAVVRLNPS